MPIVNKKEIRVVGLQRSGNHAIINWILSQCVGKICFLNFAKPFTNPFVSAHQNRLPQFCEDFELEKERRGPSPKDCLLYNYEDDHLRDIFNSFSEKKHDKWMGKSFKIYNVLILRDPFNFFASRFHWVNNPLKNYSGKIPAKNKKNINLLVNLWKVYAREYLGITNYIKENKVIINYNKWFANKHYRKQIARQLNLKFTDKSINTCAVFSTFENVKNARKLNILNRWKNFKKNKNYLELFSDKDLINLSNKIFGDITKKSIN